jgi:surface antigen
VVANASGNSISVLLGNGDGTFGGKTDFTTGTQPQSLVIADFDRDGKLDVATANNTAGSGSVSVLLGNGLGGYLSHVEFATGANPGSIAAGDLDGDGKLDVAVASFGPSTCSATVTARSRRMSTTPWAAVHRRW